ERGSGGQDRPVRRRSTPVHMPVSRGGSRSNGAGSGCEGSHGRRPRLASWRTHVPRGRWKEPTMSDQETGQVTGTKDKDYNLVWCTEACLSNALRLEGYVQDAERDGDTELAELFAKAQRESTKGAEQGKALLAARLGR